MNEVSQRSAGNRVADMVVAAIVVAGWCCLFWLWMVEYEKRLHQFAEARLKIPLFTQSVMEKLPYLAGGAAILCGIWLWLEWHRQARWWQSTLLVAVMLGLNGTVALGLRLTDAAYEHKGASKTKMYPDRFS